MIKLKSWPALALTLAVGACGDFFAGPIFGSGSGEARVRVVNAASPTFDLLHNSIVVAAAIPYAGTSLCVTVDAASHGLSFRYGAITLGYASGLYPGDRPTIFATTHSATGQTIYQHIAVHSVPTPTSGQASLTVVNASGTGGYDVYVAAPGAPLGTPIASALSGLGQQSQPLGIAEGSQQIRLTNSGTQTVAIDVGTRAFVAGEKVVLVISPPAPSTSAVRTFFEIMFDC